MKHFNSDLADIGFKIFNPCKNLEPYIHNYWIVRKQTLNEAITNKILNDGNSGIVINFSKAFCTTINKKEFNFCDKFTYNGPGKHPLFIRFEDSIDAIGIRFKAAGAYEFFNEDISQYKDSVVVLKNDENFKFNELYEQIVQKSDLKEKIFCIEAFLINKIKHSKKKNSSWIFAFIDAIFENEGNVNIEELCKNFNINPRLCARRFKIEVGISAKLLARLTRIVKTKEKISTLKLESLTTIAYDKGFFDQSHFTNEFKSFMYETPKDYFSKKYKMAKTLNFKEFVE